MNFDNPDITVTLSCKELTVYFHEGDTFSLTLEDSDIDLREVARYIGTLSPRSCYTDSPREKNGVKKVRVIYDAVTLIDSGDIHNVSLENGSITLHYAGMWAKQKTKSYSVPSTLTKLTEFFLKIARYLRPTTTLEEINKKDKECRELARRISEETVKTVSRILSDHENQNRDK